MLKCYAKTKLWNKLVNLLVDIDRFFSTADVFVIREVGKNKITERLEQTGVAPAAGDRERRGSQRG